MERDSVIHVVFAGIIWQYHRGRHTIALAGHSEWGLKLHDLHERRVARDGHSEWGLKLYILFIPPGVAPAASGGCGLITMTSLSLLRTPAHTTVASEIDAFLADLRHRRGVSENTIDAYRYDLTTAAQTLTGPLDAITTAQIESFLSGRDEKTSTNNRRIASLRRFFTWAMRQGLCGANPVADVEAKRDETRLPRPIESAADLRALDAAIAATALPYRLIFTILRETGMRADEVLSLNVGDVCLEPSREGLRVREAKNSHERIVVLNSDVMKLTLRGLRAFLRNLGPVEAHGPLFRSNRGTRISYDTLHYQWGQLCARAGLVVAETERPRYTIHQLRHTAASAFIRRYPIHIVSRMLGHRDLRSTQVYAAITEEQVRAALAEM